MIRFATQKDVAQINVIRKQVNDLHVEGEPKVFRGFVKEIAEHIKEFLTAEDKQVIVYEEDSKILGYAMIQFTIKPQTPYRFEQKYVDVQELGVLEGIRSKGYGKMLIEKIKEVAKERGFNRLELNVWSFNKRALNFYDKLGFETYREYLRIDV